MSNAFSRRRAGPLLVPAAALVLAGAILVQLGVPLAFQLAIAALASVLALAGMALLAPLRRELDDAVTFALGGLLLGLAGYALSFEILAHRVVFGLLGLDSPRAVGVFALVPFVPPALYSAWRLARGKFRDCGGPRYSRALAAASVLALVASAGTTWGAMNNMDEYRLAKAGRIERLAKDHELRDSTLPSWGIQGDTYHHLFSESNHVVFRGLPMKTQVHRGVTYLMLGLVLAAGDFDETRSIGAAKVLALPIWTALLYLGFVLARRVFALSRALAGLCMLGWLFFGPLDLLLLRPTEPLVAGAIGPSAGMLHNLPQLYSSAMGALGVLLVCLALRGRAPARAFTLGCLAFALSFWIKPSLFTIAGPAAALAWTLLPSGSRRRSLPGLALLAAPIVWWFAYSRLSSAAPILDDWTVAPLHYFGWATAERYPAWLVEAPALHASAFLVAGLGAFLLPLAWQLAGGAREALHGGLARLLRRRRVEIFVLTLFFLGVASGLLLAEDGQRMLHGNFTWALASGYLLALPLLVRALDRLPFARLRVACGALLVLHLVAGVLYFETTL